jgi:carboxypeptidase C (cathepsin A)
MGLEPETRTHANLVRYKAGHMVYLEAATRKQLKHDFAAFVQQALSSAKPGPSK